jgi:hypothetical protein
MIALCYKYPEIQDITLREFRIVAPVVAGSIPVIHPTLNPCKSAKNAAYRGLTRPDVMIRASVRYSSERQASGTKQVQP